MVKMLDYLVLIWLQHYTENFLSPPHEHHIQSLFAASCELEEFERICCQVWDCLKDGNVTGKTILNVSYFLKLLLTPDIHSTSLSNLCGTY